MRREEISVRQWQEQFKAGTFDSPDIHTQCGAGWYDWFCQDKALAGRLKKIAKVVMGITNPWFPGLCTTTSASSRCPGNGTANIFWSPWTILL